MAVTTESSLQMADGYRGRPIDDHGKLRFAYFEFTQSAAAGDIGSTIELMKLPPGAKRVIPCLSRITCSAFGAARTLAIGHRAYRKAGVTAGGLNVPTDEALNASAFVAALDVSAALNAAAISTVVEYDMFSQNEVTIYATVAGGTIPAGTTIKGFFVYVYE